MTKSVSKCTGVKLTLRTIARDENELRLSQTAGEPRSRVRNANFEGPTPRPLERAEITVSPDDGQLVVDKALRFLYERGQWSDPKAFIKLA